MRKIFLLALGKAIDSINRLLMQCSQLINGSNSISGRISKGLEKEENPLLVIASTTDFCHAIVVFYPVKFQIIRYVQRRSGKNVFLHEKKSY